MAEIAKQKMWVLRTIPYREYGLYVDLFSENNGKISAIVHGSRKPNSPMKSLLQPFNCIIAEIYSKNSDLWNIRDAELGYSFVLAQREMLCAQYINELLYYLLEKNVPEPNVFANYHIALKQLSCVGDNSVEILLRGFELDLLESLGYGINFNNDCYGNNISKTKSYIFNTSEGFIPIYETQQIKNVFIGSELELMCKRDFRERRVLSATKHICKVALQSLLGNRKLNTRALFAQYLAMRRK